MAAEVSTSTKAQYQLGELDGFRRFPRLLLDPIGRIVLRIPCTSASAKPTLYYGSGTNIIRINNYYDGTTGQNEIVVASGLRKGERFQVRHEIALEVGIGEYTLEFGLAMVRYPGFDGGHRPVRR